jgi:isoleucyl-tRNA synthetase
LDRWLLSRLHGLIGTVTEELEGYNIMEAARAIEAFVEELSTWYVRRNRRRFWKSEDDVDKQAAYHSLYEALTTLSRLMAPFTPFIADEIYRNLVVEANSEAPESVHLASWPEVQPGLRDESIEDDVRLAMQLSSLGRAARSKAQIKVRQPLAEALVVVPSASERESLLRIADQLREELNVKGIRAVEDEAEFVQFSVHPNLARLGPRLGRDVDKVVKVLQALEGSELADIAGRARAGLTVEVAGTTLSPEDLLVESEDRPGFVSTSEGPVSVAIDTTVTAELAQEGLARNLVRHIQELRRTAGLEISDRITAYVHGHGDLAQVLERHGDYIRQETLAVSLLAERPPQEAASETVNLEERQVTVGVLRSGE